MNKNFVVLFLLPHTLLTEKYFEKIYNSIFTIASTKRYQVNISHIIYIIIIIIIIGEYTEFKDNLNSLLILLLG